MHSAGRLVVVRADATPVERVRTRAELRDRDIELFAGAFADTSMGFGLSPCRCSDSAVMRISSEKKIQRRSATARARGRCCRLARSS